MKENFMYHLRVNSKKQLRVLAAVTAVTALIPAESLACACGCGIFEVGTSSMLPTREGGMAFLEYDFMNQNKNWNGSSRAPDANNENKDIKSIFVSAGARYMFSRTWGGAITVPFTKRHFTTTDEDSGDIVRFNHSTLGDVRVKGIYSGFSPDMSSGITFGLKLPTGDYSHHGFDRDTAIGSGSTNLLLGAYHMGNLTGMWNWYANGEWDQPVLTRNNYRPGGEVNAVGGVYYNGWEIGGVKVAPVAQIVGSQRLRDKGLAADTGNSGYGRVLLSPGIEVDAGDFKIYGDVGFPVYQHVRGNQLVPATLFKLSISRNF